MEHMLLKSAPNQVWLMDGKGFMVTSGAYKTYLAGSANQIEVGHPSIEPRLFTYPQWLSMLQQSPAVNQAKSNRSQLDSTRIGGCACARHGCFIPHAMVDFQKGEQYVCSI